MPCGRPRDEPSRCNSGDWCDRVLGVLGNWDVHNPGVASADANFLSEILTEHSGHFGTTDMIFTCRAVANDW